MGTSPHLIRKHIEDAARSAAATEEKLQEEATENRRAYEKFYNNLALLSGGTIALSVTYLGYLKSLARPVISQDLLVGSWTALWVCLMAAVFTSFFHTHYMYYARMREYFGKRGRQREKEALAVDQLPIINLSNPSDQDAARTGLTEAARTYAKREQSLAWREKVHMHTWMWLGRTARVAFVLGLTQLLWFAVRNT